MNAGKCNVLMLVAIHVSSQNKDVDRTLNIEFLELPDLFALILLDLLLGAKFSGPNYAKQKSKLQFQFFFSLSFFPSLQAQFPPLFILNVRKK